MSEETTWVEFEIWNGEISVMGYMALDEAEDEKPLNFYDRFGLECYGDISKTNPFPSPSSELEEELVKDWEDIVEFIITTDVVSWLVKYATAAHIEEFGDMELYINCSKIPKVSHTVEDKTTTIRIKQSTKDKLDEYGIKGMTYDDIVNKLIEDSRLLRR